MSDKKDDSEPALPVGKKDYRLIDFELFYPKTGYFAATGTLTWTLELKNLEGRTYQTLTETYDDVRPRQHYNFQFSLGEVTEFGGASVEVVLDDSTKDKTYNLLLDFEANVRPTVTSYGFDMFQTTKYAEGVTVDGKFILNVPGGFKAAYLKHALSALSNNSLPYNFYIMNLSNDDRTYYSQKGIKIPVIRNGDTRAEIDLSGMFAKLPLGSYKIEFYICTSTLYFHYINLIIIK